MQPTVHYSPTLPSGYILRDYRIERTLGRGGFGITYLAKEELTERYVVIKENFPDGLAHRNQSDYSVGPAGSDRSQQYDWALGSFINEVRTLAGLHHTNIVPVFSAFREHGTAYYVMPHIGGTPLHLTAAAQPEISETWLRQHLQALLSALSYLHTQSTPLLHRDIKPDNILIDASGNPILIDFGTARAVQGTHTQTKMGTPGYAPLEQWSAGGKRGPWTDLYALGATFYRLLTGENPPDCHERLYATPGTYQLAGNAALASRYSAELLSSIDRAFAMNPAERWQSAQDWLETIQPGQIPAPAPQTASNEDEIVPTNYTTELSPQDADLYERCVDLVTRSRKASTPMLQRTFSIGYGKAAKMMDLMEQRGVIGPKQGSSLYHTVLKSPAAEKATEQRFPSDPDILQAALLGNTAQLRHLLNTGANANSTNSHGDTPLMLAIWGKHTACVKELLDHGADVNQPNSEGLTPLFCAALTGHSESLRLLLGVPGIYVNRQNRHGWTPLCAAVDNGHTDCVKLLLTAPDININIANNNGHTPMSIALKKEQTDIIRLLQKALSL